VVVHEAVVLAVDREELSIRRQRIARIVTGHE
jgi:hypothetical protein